VGLGTSLVLIAVGAILRFAVSVSTHGFNLHTVGVILMVVGGVGLLISVLWMTTWRDRRAARPGYVRRTGYSEREVPPADTY
jgi:sulfite exporter TauE/SafE